MFKSSNKMRQKRIRAIADALKALDVGEQITHVTLAKVSGINPCPNELYQAGHVLANKESGCYFDSVRGEGYVRRPPSEWDGVAIKYRERIRRSGKRGRKFVSNIVGKSNQLSDEEQRRASREIGLLQTIEAMTRRISSQ